MSLIDDAIEVIKAGKKGEPKDRFAKLELAVAEAERKRELEKKEDLAELLSVVINAPSKNPQDKQCKVEMLVFLIDHGAPANERRMLNGVEARHSVAADVFKSSQVFDLNLLRFLVVIGGATFSQMKASHPRYQASKAEIAACLDAYNGSHSQDFKLLSDACLLLGGLIELIGRLPSQEQRAYASIERSYQARKESCKVKLASIIEAEPALPPVGVVARVGGRTRARSAPILVEERASSNASGQATTSFACV